MDMEIISKFLESFLLALAPVLASLVAAWLALKIKELWASFSEGNPDVAMYVQEAAAMAVKAAEQANLAGLIQDKKTYALGLAESWLKATYKLTIDLDLIAAAIEAAVLDHAKEFERVAEIRENKPVL